MAWHRVFALGLSVVAAEEQTLDLEDVDLPSFNGAVSLLQMHVRRAQLPDSATALIGNEEDKDNVESDLLIPHRHAAKTPEAEATDLGSLFAGENARIEGYISSSMMSDSEMHGLERRQAPEIADGTWSFDVAHAVKVVAWTGQFAMDLNVLEKLAPKCSYHELPHSDVDITYIWGHKACCDWEFVISDPETDISDADVVLFYLPYIQRTDWRTSMPSTKKPGQMWIATCGEPMSRPETGMDCSLANDEEFMKNIDGLSSHLATSEFPVFNDPPSEELMRFQPPDFASRGGELATVVVSDCAATERTDWMTAVVSEFESRGKGDAVLSYGKCFHNAEEPSKECLDNSRWFDCWANRCGSRTFKFVGENLIEPWYVTEKLWDAFWEGAIPIYWGPPEVKELVPPDSMIFWQDYESAAALVEALLSFTDADVQRMRAWKTQPVSEWGNYTEVRRQSHATFLPRVCEAASKAKAMGA